MTELSPKPAGLSAVSGWRNRLIGSDDVAPDQLLANPLNWRIHVKAQQDALVGSLDSVGWIRQILVNQRTGHVVDGHLRVALALRNDEPTVPVVYVDLSEEEELLVLATLDPLAAMASADTDVLAELLAQVETDDAALQALLDGLADEYDIDLGDEPPEDPGAQIDKAAELQAIWGTALGQVWEIGPHRLAVGDCTDPQVVAAVMRGERAAMVWTDPPYNVRYGESKGPHHKPRAIEGDWQSPEEWREFVRAFGNQIKRVCEGDVYVWGAAGPDGMRMRTQLIDMGLHWSGTIIWKKQHFVLSPAKYQRKYEMLLYGWFGSKSSYTGPANEDDVWEIDRPKSSPEHPTMKPLETATRAIENSSRAGDIVLDLFVGSGTCLIACERLGRRGRGIELDPGYCAVAIQRLVDMGLTARLADESS